MFDRRKGRTARRGPELCRMARRGLFVFFCLPQQAAAAGSVLRSGSTGPDVVLAQHVLYQSGVPQGVAGRRRAPPRCKRCGAFNKSGGWRPMG